ncbi:MAG: hypothetical protein BWK80_00535 [Desulfobacteraceae bacterium IS3]|nr:MAG: hypothetical protein BWK80_00535 [Desulfobacteraceae bacterium IS3]
MSNDNEKKYKVLIVDDMPINLQVLSGFLKEDYHVRVATTGKKAIEIAGSENPSDLILLDIMMPETDGFEVCRRLKDDPATRDIPVIFITAKGNPEDETLGLELGAADYISKPFHPGIVKARIKTQLALKDSNDRLKQMNRELQQVLTEIRTLRGFLPICSNCKKIRKADSDPENQNSWVRLEEYIREHTHAEFSHGLCPTCAKKLYPEFFKEIKD